MYFKKLIFGYRQISKEGNQVVFKKHPSILERIFGKKTVALVEDKSVKERLEDIQNKIVHSIANNPRLKKQFDSFLESNVENTVAKMPNTLKRRIVNSGLEEKVLNSVVENLINIFLRSLTNKILLGSAIGMGSVTPALASNYTDAQILSLLNNNEIVESANDFVDVSFGTDDIIVEMDISGNDITGDVTLSDIMVDSIVTEPDLYSFADDFTNDLANIFSSVDYSDNYSDFVDFTPDTDGLDDMVSGIADFFSSLFN